jgi:hypothetical protein
VLIISVSHCSSAFFWVIRWNNFSAYYVPFYLLDPLFPATIFLVSVCALKHSKPGRFLFISDSVTVFVGSLYAEAIEAL